MREIKLKSLRDKIAIVFQDNFLFDGTIRENIMLGNENATEEELLKAVENACLSDVIKEMPTRFKAFGRTKTTSGYRSRLFEKCADCNFR